MFPLHFHYEDVSRQDLLLKPNHANVMEVPGSCKIRVVPKAAPSDFIIKNGKLAMEIPRGQKLIQKKRASTGKSFRSNPFLGSNKGSASDLARQSALRGHGMYNFLFRISTVMSLLDSPVEIRENSIQFSMETEFCELSPELGEHFEIFEHIRGFNVTIVTSANTQDETLPLWSGFLQKEEGESQRVGITHCEKEEGESQRVGITHCERAAFVVLRALFAFFNPLSFLFAFFNPLGFLFEIFDPLVCQINETFPLREQIRRRFNELFREEMPRTKAVLPPYTRKRGRMQEAIENLSEDTYGTRDDPEAYREMLHEISNEDIEGSVYCNLFYWVTKRKRPVF